MRIAHVRRAVVPLLLLGSLAAPAAATEAPPGGPQISGVLLLPDGATPAPAGAVDLLVNGVAVARDVTGYDGRFAVGLPETPELLALAATSGGQLPVQWRASKLIPAPPGDAQPSSGDVGSWIEVGDPKPIFTQEIGSTVAWLVNTVTGKAYDVLEDSQAYLNPGDWQFHFPPLNPDTIVGKVVDTVAPLSIFNDPDYVTGNEDLNDPDAVPPLNVVFEQVELPLDVPAEVTAPAGAMLGPAGDITGSGNCKVNGSYWYPKPGDNQPTNGLNQETFVALFDCNADDRDIDNDYWTIGFDGSVSTYDPPDVSKLALWRFKYRFELVPGDAEIAKGGYWWINTDPEVDYSDDVSAINWVVGWQGVAPYGEIGGSFKPNIGRLAKFHQWRDDAHHTNGRGKKALWHGSWLAKGQYGVPGGIFGNGGGVAFRVPGGVPYETVVGTTKRSITTWRCWHTGQGRGMRTVCDPAR